MIIDFDTVSQTHALYTLDLENRRAVKRCTNPLEWMDWMKTNANEIERTKLPNNRELVTVFAGYAGEHRESRPLVFCTLIKPEPQLPDFAVMLQWYATFEEARDGHGKLANSFSQVREKPSGLNAMMRRKNPGII